MANSQALEGTWEELEPLVKNKPGQRFRLIPSPAEKKDASDKAPRMIRKGMFPQLRDLTEEDFKCAEWRGRGAKSVLA